jgi:tetratricopeptide (TPR) repeat protein
VNFIFSRVRRVVNALGAVALLSGLVSTPAAFAQGTSTPPAGQQPAATGQTTKNWKDRAEYDLYVKISQTTDPKQRLELLNTWTDKYPQTDYSQERQQYYMVTLSQLAPNDPNARKQLVDKAEDVLKTDPNNFTAAYYITTFGPQIPGTPSPDLLNEVDAAAHAMLDNVDKQFAPDKKPASTSPDQWNQAKVVATALAHNTLAWVATQKKDTAGAEEQYKASLQANPNQPNVSYAYAKMLMDEKKYSDALFEYARAASYDGTGALPQSARDQIKAYFDKVYAQFHGSPDGADQVITQAKANALPPDGFKIEGAGDIAAAQAKALEDRMNADPAFKLWYTIQTNLTGDQSDQFWANTVKDAEIPGGAEGVKNFSGTVISIDPPDRPTKVVLGVTDPQTPDATLLFSQPLPASALDKIKIGQKLEFSGVADSYSKNPYMLTFKDPSVPGVQTTAPPKRSTRPRRTGHSK